MRDYLGNITHQVNTSNTVIAEFNFDTCSMRIWLFVSHSETKALAELIPISKAVREGRRRDKDIWSYTLDNGVNGKFWIYEANTYDYSYGRGYNWNASSGGVHDVSSLSNYL